MYLSGEGDNVYLTSGFQSPFSEHDFIQQLQVACEFQSYATGGSVLHVFLGEEITPEQKNELIKRISDHPVQYFSITPVLSVCNECGNKRVGKYRKCTKCSSDDVSIWTRPIGYFRPALRKNISEDYKTADYKFWSDGRLQDFSERKIFTIEDLKKIKIMKTE